MAFPRYGEVSEVVITPINGSVWVLPPAGFAGQFVGDASYGQSKFVKIESSLAPGYVCDFDAILENEPKWEARYKPGEYRDGWVHYRVFRSGDLMWIGVPQVAKGYIQWA
ncbi:hypothetical protein ECTOBSL9_1251 [Ectothiorhodospira sp. BSL-9]|nr:hypothetical protein ECTOBSL9_1251 [Ectothiorhodospira sp. BSL-9]